jgi:hypothetical protein
MSSNPYAPPKAAVADRPISSSDLKRRSVFLMIVFTLFSFGVYFLIWFLRRRAALNTLNSPRKLRLWPLLALLTLIVTDFVTIVAAFGRPLEAVIGEGATIALGVARIAVTILMVVQCFIIKGMLEDHIDTLVDPAEPALFSEHVQLSAVATFFLSIFYLQYAINKYIADPQ